jgi:sRNA-binding regulator protein Hfq
MVIRKTVNKQFLKNRRKKEKKLSIFIIERVIT